MRTATNLSSHKWQVNQNSASSKMILPLVCLLGLLVLGAEFSLIDDIAVSQAEFAVEFGLAKGTDLEKWSNGNKFIMLLRDAVSHGKPNHEFQHLFADLKEVKIPMEDYPMEPFHLELMELSVRRWPKWIVSIPEIEIHHWIQFAVKYQKYIDVIPMPESPPSITSLIPTFCFLNSDWVPLLVRLISMYGCDHLVRSMIFHSSESELYPEHFIVYLHVINDALTQGITSIEDIKRKLLPSYLI